ncbi:MAG: PH domain-containing protein [Prolixibacteraceae bacterium]|nr:PH domain-containing protein [Prolixibacteraceae bacterium]
MKTNLKTEEEVVLELHPHWFTMVLPILITGVGVVGGIMLSSINPLFLILAVIVILYFLFKVVQRSNNIWVVTNLRVIDEEGVLTSKSKESPLDKINNINYRQTFWGKIFGYGDVEIQTAAEIGATTYRMVTSPKRLKDTITQMQEEYKDSIIKRQAEQMARAMVDTNQERINVPDELEKLYELMKKGVITEEEYNLRKEKLLNS